MGRNSSVFWVKALHSKLIRHMQITLIHCTATVHHQSCDPKPNDSNCSLCSSPPSILTLVLISYCHASPWDLNLGPLHISTYLLHGAQGTKKRQAAQAVSSWNEWLTYKGRHCIYQSRGRDRKTKIHQGPQVSLSQADWMDCCQMRKAKLRREFSKGWAEKPASFI